MQDLEGLGVISHCNRSADVMTSANSITHNSRARNLQHQRFGKLVVLSRTADYISPKGERRTCWLCQCDCGRTKSIMAQSLMRGLSTSCGCNWIPPISLPIHGMRKTKIYRLWCSMKDRCYNKNCEHYADYGGRGIYVCERWQQFEFFYADMGNPPAQAIQ